MRLVVGSSFRRAVDPGGALVLFDTTALAQFGVSLRQVEFPDCATLAIHTFIEGQGQARPIADAAIERRHRLPRTQQFSFADGFLAVLESLPLLNARGFDMPDALDLLPVARSAEGKLIGLQFLR